MDIDIRSQKLQWIRDGSNWLVGLAAGGLGLSGTYFFEKFYSTPHWRWALVIAWFSLAVSTFAGVLTSFATWKDLREPTDSYLELGGWVRYSYTVMMWTFIIGYVALAFSLIANALTNPKRTNGLVKVELPAHPASYTLTISSSAKGPHQGQTK